MPTARRITLLTLAATLWAGLGAAQFRFDRGFSPGNLGTLVQTEGGEWVDEDTVRTARETAPHSIDLPVWTNTPGFEKDVFTFTRIIFKSAPGGPSWLGWINDYPDADLNLSARLQLLTSLRTDPDCRVLKLTDPALAELPFIFMSHPERMELRDAEVSALRKYLANGGALLVDDFWGGGSWERFEQVMHRVLPDRTWTELTMEHPLFHCVFDLHGPMSHLQVPTLQLWRRGYDPADPEAFPSVFRGQGSREMHVRAWLDPRQRIWSLPFTTPTPGTAGNARGRTKCISTNSPRIAPTPSPSTRFST